MSPSSRSFCHVLKTDQWYSFLDVNYSHLIRWSDDGRSFIVLDEDEFARTLIPELFKHNNYASFVRQLNMYGFHKTVNITDGSLRQSEKARKGVKPPSMYSHPYFRQGRPDLLWLIQKPTGKAPSKKKREPGVKGEGFDSDDERQFSPGPEGRTHGELGNIGGNQDLTSMPRGELNAVKHEIKKLQQQQGIISRMIQQLKEQNDHFYRQATAFQALHDRHENSINAILTFLATFYSRSLEGHQGQNLANLFGSAATQNNQQQPQGGVVEEYNDSTQEADNQVQRYAKRPQLLLTGPNASSSPFQEAGNAMTAPNSARASVSPAEDGPSFPHKRDSSTSAPPVRPNSGAVAMAAQSPVVKDDAQTPDLLNSVPENDQMLSLINNMNATTTPSNDSTPAYEYSDALNNIQKANGIGSLTKQQTNDVMAILASQGAAGASANNALTRLDPNENLDMSKLRETQQSIERLSQLSSDNSTRLTDLQARLGPFSPSGSVPGMSYGGGEPNYGDPGQYDPNNFVKFDEYNDDDINYFNHDGFDWGFDPNAQIVEQGSGADVFSGGDDGIPVDRLAPQPTGHGIIESDAPNPAQEADTGNGDGAKVESSPSNKRRRIS